MSAVTEWLKNPVIHVRITNDNDVEYLQNELEIAKRRAAEAEGRYQQELIWNLRLQDILKKYGIKER